MNHSEILESVYNEAGAKVAQNDLAIYNAKQAGKDPSKVFSTSSSISAA